MFRMLPIFEDGKLVGLDWETNIQPYEHPRDIKQALDYLTIRNPASDFATKFKDNFFEKNAYSQREVELWAEIANIIAPLFTNVIPANTSEFENDMQAAMSPMVLLRNCFMFIYNQRKLLESYYKQYGIAPCDKQE